MMFKISGNEIYITKGDTGRFNVAIKYKNGAIYRPQKGEVLTFTVKKSITDAVPVIQKKITNYTEGETTQFVILPADTEGLKVGKYIYDIEMQLANGDINTIITPHDFNILEGVS
jgi:hypothetical protein